MVVYFGVADVADTFIVKSAEKKGRAFRVAYEFDQSEVSLKARHQHFAWVPLGRLQPGVYTLELFDAKAMEVTLMRRVTVEK